MGDPRATGGVPSPAGWGPCPGVLLLLSRNKRGIEAGVRTLKLVRLLRVRSSSCSSRSGVSGFLAGCSTLSSSDSTHRPVAQGLQKPRHSSPRALCSLSAQGRAFPIGPTSRRLLAESLLPRGWENLRLAFLQGQLWLLVITSFPLLFLAETWVLASAVASAPKCSSLWSDGHIRWPDGGV